MLYFILPVNATTLCPDKKTPDVVPRLKFLRPTEVRISTQPGASFIEQADKDDIHRSSKDFCITAFTAADGRRWIAYRRDAGAQVSRYVPAEHVEVMLGRKKVELDFSSGESSVPRSPPASVQGTK